jgi:tyramine---L-glutamate ligase
MQNKIVKKLFVCEFITCGGLNGEHLPASLAQEGLLMRDALLHDLQALDDWQVITTHDVRVVRSQYAADSIAVDVNTDVMTLWQNCMQTADYIWIIAPESSNILYQLTEMAVASNKVVIGCDLATIAITSDKYKTAKLLQQANINTIASDYFDEWQPQAEESKWVVKPVDGAGCEQTFLFENTQQVKHWFATHDKQAHIIQPYISAIAASVSVLATPSGPQILSCNLQYISVQDGQFIYRGGEINGALSYSAYIEPILKQLQQALAGLHGYYGVDLLLDAQDLAKITIVEINPRLTTSYIGLSAAIGCNLAALILEAAINPDFVMPTITKKKINFDLTH